MCRPVDFPRAIRVVNDRYRQLSSVAISSKPTAVLDFVLPLDRYLSWECMFG